jgi:hypothetical protein
VEFLWWFAQDFGPFDVTLPAIDGAYWWVICHPEKKMVKCIASDTVRFKDLSKGSSLEIFVSSR